MLVMQPYESNKAPGVYISEGIWVRPPAKRPVYENVEPRYFSVPLPPTPSITFNTVVTPSSGVVETTFTLEVTATNVSNGTLLPFTVSGSGYLLTTSGQVEIQNNFGSAPINTGYSPVLGSPLKDVPAGDLCTATLGGIATGLPGTSANFIITPPVPPTPTNFEATWRNNSSLTIFSVANPE